MYDVIVSGLGRRALTMTGNQPNLLRIGIFYDGQYFFHVSSYYKYQHSKKTRISIEGLHDFIRHHVAQECDIEPRLCQIVDAHYFRGRFSAKDVRRLSQDTISENPSEDADYKLIGEKLLNDRIFEDILMSANVTLHSMLLKTKPTGEKQEKGVDVWLALEAFEQAIYKKFDIIVLIACDGDYVPLVRKLNTLGTKVMLLSWDFTYTNEQGAEMGTKTSHQLLKEVSYPVKMVDEINRGLEKKDDVIERLFRHEKNIYKSETQDEDISATAIMDTGDDASTETFRSTILSLKDGFGFIKDPINNNIFFHFSTIENADFNSLMVEQPVEYTRVKSQNPNYKYCAGRVWVVT
jgi:cold shock CspA family protein/uncharacterized LabA/DUF88 family protein